VGFTISERPIFLCNLQQVDEYILPPQTKALVQTVCDRFVKALFLFDGSPLVERQLDEYAIFRLAPTMANFRLPAAVS
jgi:hypothetical protein